MKKLVRKMFVPVIILAATFLITLIPMERKHPINNDDTIVKDDGNSREGIYILSIRKQPSKR